MVEAAFAAWSLHRAAWSALQDVAEPDVAEWSAVLVVQRLWNRRVYEVFAAVVHPERVRASLQLVDVVPAQYQWQLSLLVDRVTKEQASCVQLEP